MSEDNIAGPLTDEPGPDEAPQTKRLVYEPKLQLRSRKRTPRWLLALLVVGLGAALYYLVAVYPHLRRFVLTAKMITVSAAAAGETVHHIWVCGSDGTGLKQITSGSSDDIDPVFSSDGNQIAFLSNRVGGIYQVCLVDADGKNLVSVTKKGSPKTMLRADPTDPTMFYFVSNGLLNRVSTYSLAVERILPQGVAAHKTGDTSEDSGGVAIKSYALAPGKNGATMVAAVEETDGYQQLALLPDPAGAELNSRTTASPEPHKVLPLLAADLLTVAWSHDSSKVLYGAQGVAGMRQGLSALGYLQPDGTFDPAGPVVAVKNPQIGFLEPCEVPDGTWIMCTAWRQSAAGVPEALGLAKVGRGLPGVIPILRGNDSQIAFGTDSTTVYCVDQQNAAHHTLMHLDLDARRALPLLPSFADVPGYDVSKQQPK